ncbi:exodeoxyribonuclease VII large subunit [Novosphingobium sp. Leaf2]|uniref:exodeoxyribonuclease VII large subunit n=1 Tax=Novosphingobium sp. Leaf2 TaxID=1735670 RepID=UPI00070006A3|nr:exodeoxyribonuclease VII large subunit [Novosphingobium sp. Leaf2]KQM21786.1 exodeoxyribonuclease VII large subunit [Novosphingobium sp. Leaf2]
MPSDHFFQDDDAANGSGANRSGGLVAKETAGDNAAPLSISEISNLLKRTVEDRFGFVRLRGELSGVKRAASGHLYCALKDDKAVIDGVMWKGGAQRLAFRPEDGVEVIATGKLTTYPGRSKYQIVIETMEIAGEGALLALLEKLRARLAAEGLFAPERKRALPFLPRVIGVVTSPTGAVIRDILHRLADRFPTHVLVWPVLVQGEGSAQQVANAVRGFSALQAGGPVPRPDLVIVARGGGSIEDLWGFNEEAVVRAVAESTIPVISAVGHETDTTLCDYAADRRAPTPTAAAEMAVPVRADLTLQLEELALRKRRCALRPVALGRERLEARVQRLPRPEAMLAAGTQKLDDLSERLRRALRDEARRKERQLQQVAGSLSLPLLRHRVQAGARDLARAGLTPRVLSQRLDRARHGFAPWDRVLTQLNPRLPLQRGYALVKTAGGAALTTRAAAACEPALTIEFRDGELAVVVGEGPGSAPVRKPVRPAPAMPGQDDLFSR